MSNLQHLVFLAGWLQPQERDWGDQQGGGGNLPRTFSPTPVGQRGPATPQLPHGLGRRAPGLVSGQGEHRRPEHSLGGCEGCVAAPPGSLGRDHRRPRRLLIASGSWPSCPFHLLSFAYVSPPPLPRLFCSLPPTRKQPAVSGLFCPGHGPALGCGCPRTQAPEAGGSSVRLLGSAVSPCFALFSVPHLASGER